MTFPAVQKYFAAGMALNQRLTFTSLNQILSAYITAITTQAIAKGFTRVGSCNGTTGALDGVSRWSSTAAVRGANATTAQSWDIIQAANGAQTLFAYTGTSDDIATISCSPGGLYVLAGTPTFKPTATDEFIGPSSSTLIGTTTSGDRIANVWIDNAHNSWRAAVFRANIVAGTLIGCELFDPAFIVAPGATCPVPVWCFLGVPVSISSAATVLGPYASVNAGGQTRMVVGGVPMTISMGATCKALGLQASAENNVVQELNGSNFLFRPIGLYSVTTNGKGDIGNRFDWLFSNEMKACGELDASKSWLLINNASAAGVVPGVLWPWDTVSAWVGS